MDAVDDDTLVHDLQDELQVKDDTIRRLKDQVTNISNKQFETMKELRKMEGQTRRLQVDLESRNKTMACLKEANAKLLQLAKSSLSSPKHNLTTVASFAVPSHHFDPMDAHPLAVAIEWSDLALHTLYQKTECIVREWGAAIQHQHSAALSAAHDAHVRESESIAIPTLRHEIAQLLTIKEEECLQHAQEVSTMRLRISELEEDIKQVKTTHTSPSPPPVPTDSRAADLEIARLLMKQKELKEERIPLLESLSALERALTQSHSEIENLRAQLTASEEERAKLVAERKRIKSKYEAQQEKYKILEVEGERVRQSMLSEVDQLRWTRVRSNEIVERETARVRREWAERVEDLERNLETLRKELAAKEQVLNEVHNRVGDQVYQDNENRYRRGQSVPPAVSFNNKLAGASRAQSETNRREVNDFAGESTGHSTHPETQSGDWNVQKVMQSTPVCSFPRDLAPPAHQIQMNGTQMGRSAPHLYQDPYPGACGGFNSFPDRLLEKAIHVLSPQRNNNPLKSR